MRKLGPTYQFVALELSSLIWMSLSCAGPASLENAYYRLQFKTNATTTLATIRGKGAAENAARIAHGPMVLDLRVPESLRTAASYPSIPNRHFSDTESENASRLQFSLAKSRSPAEAFANRLHREGLPLARVWENKSAFVSLGLNQRGKPGLWLIQKTH
jgi:hypothetical protein